MKFNVMKKNNIMYWYMDKNGKIKQNNNGNKCQLKMYLQM